jgi:hypothetical protein
MDVKTSNQHRHSTMEAEYTALSIALRAAIPLLDVIRFVISAFFSPLVLYFALRQQCMRIIKVP